MMTLKHFKKENAPAWFNRLPLVSGILSALLGLIVLTGWHTHNATLLKVSSPFEAMRYNSALAFFLSGIGFVTAHFGLKRQTRIYAAIVAALGLLTFSEYVFAGNIGIDEFFFKDTLSAAFPGRMASSTALCFSFVGFALFLIYSPFWRRQRSLLMGLLGSMVFSIGITALFGYVTGVAAFIAWNEFVAMAAHTSAGFVILGAGMISFAWRGEEGEEIRPLRWLPATVGICVVTGTLVLWRVAVAQEMTNIRQNVSSKANIVKDHIQYQTGDKVLALIRMARRWEAHGRPPKGEWESDARLYLEHYAGLSSLEWVSPSLQAQWTVSKNDAPGLDSRYGFESDLYSSFLDARSRRDAVIPSPRLFPEANGY